MEMADKGRREVEMPPGLLGATFTGIPHSGEPPRWAARTPTAMGQPFSWEERPGRLRDGNRRQLRASPRPANASKRRPPSAST